MEQKLKYNQNANTDMQNIASPFIFLFRGWGGNAWVGWASGNEVKGGRGERGTSSAEVN